MLKLPTFTFITGYPNSGKSTLGTIISAQDQGMIRLGFADPLREALASTFYDGITDLDLTDPLVKKTGLPLNPNWTHRQFLIDYSTFLKSKTNDRILGDIAKRRWEGVRDAYPRVVFDDARTIDDAAPFIDGYGMDACILLVVEMPGIGPLPGDVGQHLPLLKLPGLRKFVVRNGGTPEDMLPQIASFLNP